MGARTAGLYGVTRGRETVITQTSTQLFRASRSLFSPAPVVVVQLVGVLTRLVTGNEELPLTGPHDRGPVAVVDVLAHLRLGCFGPCY
jgi:hypothetical protein